MRPVTDVSPIENARLENNGVFTMVRCDSVEPEPVGTIVLMPFRIAGYDKDCDGSLMARLQAIEVNGEQTGWEPSQIGLYPNTTIVVTKEELKKLFEEAI